MRKLNTRLDDRYKGKKSVKITHGGVVVSPNNSGNLPAAVQPKLNHHDNELHDSFRFSKFTGATLPNGNRYLDVHYNGGRIRVRGDKNWRDVWDVKGWENPPAIGDLSVDIPAGYEQMLFVPWENYTPQEETDPWGTFTQIVGPGLGTRLVRGDSFLRGFAAHDVISGYVREYWMLVGLGQVVGDTAKKTLLYSFAPNEAGKLNPDEGEWIDVAPMPTPEWANESTKRLIGCGVAACMPQPEYEPIQWGAVYAGLGRATVDFFVPGVGTITGPTPLNDWWKFDRGNVSSNTNPGIDSEPWSELAHLSGNESLPPEALTTRPAAGQDITNLPSVVSGGARAAWMPNHQGVYVLISEPYFWNDALQTPAWDTRVGKQDLWHYQIADDEWTLITTLELPSTGFVMAADHPTGKLYIGYYKYIPGVLQPTIMWYAYDVKGEAGEYKTSPDFSSFGDFTSSVDGEATFLGGKIYLTQSVSGGGGFTKVLALYNPEDDTWQYGPIGLPSTEWEMTCAIELIQVPGGISGNLSVTWGQLTPFSYGDKYVISPLSVAYCVRGGVSGTSYPFSGWEGLQRNYGQLVIDGSVVWCVVAEDTGPGYIKYNTGKLFVGFGSPYGGGINHDLGYVVPDIPIARTNPLGWHSNYEYRLFYFDTVKNKVAWKYFDSAFAWPTNGFPLFLVMIRQFNMDGAITVECIRDFRSWVHESDTAIWPTEAVEGNIAVFGKYRMLEDSGVDILGQLSNTLNREANDFIAFAEKENVSGNDIILIEDTGDGGQKKYIDASSLTALGDDRFLLISSGSVQAFPQKESISGNDILLIEDSNAGGQKKYIDASALAALYVPYVGATADVDLGLKNIIANNLSSTNTGDQVGDGDTITGAGTVLDPFVATIGEIDGGFAGSVYLVSQLIDGGGA